MKKIFGPFQLVPVQIKKIRRPPPSVERAGDGNEHRATGSKQTSKRAAKQAKPKPKPKPRSKPSQSLSPKPKPKAKAKADTSNASSPGVQETSTLSENHWEERTPIRTGELSSDQPGIFFTNDAEKNDGEQLSTSFCTEFRCPFF